MITAVPINRAVRIALGAGPKQPHFRISANIAKLPDLLRKLVTAQR